MTGTVGEGAFGVVKKAILYKSENISRTVAVKTAKGESPYQLLLYSEVLIHTFTECTFSIVNIRYKELFSPP